MSELSLNYDIYQHNLYDILGIDKKSDIKTIKEVYRKKAKELHTDKLKNLDQNQKKEKEIQFKILTDAYKILINPIKRSHYDHNFSSNFIEQRSNFNDYLNEQFSMNDLIRQRNDDVLINTGNKPSNYFNPTDYNRISNDDFNKMFDKNRSSDPNDHGYQDNMVNSNINLEYNPNDIEIKRKIFKSQNDFDNNEFNNMFENITFTNPNKKLSKYKENENELEQPSGLDSFNSSNATEISNYNGLMIFGNNVNDYTDKNYTDYMNAFTDNTLAGISTDKYYRDNSISLNKRIEKLNMERNRDIKPIEKNKSVAESKLIKDREKQIELENKKREEFAKKFINQYPDHLIKDF